MNKSLCKIVSATSRSAFLQFRGQKCCETSIIIQSKTSSSSQHFSISSCPSIISQSAAIKSSSASSFLSRSLIQKRHLFIQTSDTPNVDALKFFPGVKILEPGETRDFPNYAAAYISPLARALFAIEGVKSVFFSSDFITVTKAPEHDWKYVKVFVFSAISDFVATKQPVLDANASPPDMSHLPQEDDDEIVQAIKEILETRIRPTVQEDGGDIKFVSMDENGVVYLKLQGSCSTCSSSQATLKNGVENMLMHYIPEITAVEAAKDEVDKVSEAAFAKTEKMIEEKAKAAETQ